MQNDHDRTEPSRDDADEIDPETANAVLIDVTGGDLSPLDRVPTEAPDAPGSGLVGRVDDDRRTGERDGSNAESLPESRDEVERARSTAERLDDHADAESPPADVPAPGPPIGNEDPPL